MIRFRVRASDRIRVRVRVRVMPGRHSFALPGAERMTEFRVLFVATRNFCQFPKYRSLCADVTYIINYIS